MATEDIKSCPFCGGRGLVIVWKGEQDRMVRVECIECKCSTPGIIFQLPCSPLDHVREVGWQPGLEEAKRLAVEAWNQRAKEQAKSRTPLQPPAPPEEMLCSCSPQTDEPPQPRRRPSVGDFV